MHNPAPRLEIEVALSIPSSTDRIVLLDYYHRRQKKEGDFQNLMRRRADDSIVWYADLPSPGANDAYVSADWQGNELIANSWSCYRVELDLETGHILSKTFTK